MYAFYTYYHEEILHIGDLRQLNSYSQNVYPEGGWLPRWLWVNSFEKAHFTHLIGYQQIGLYTSSQLCQIVH